MTLADLDLNKAYTYADYYKWRFDERVELIKGKIFRMSPAPGTLHQRLSSRIHLEIGTYLKGKKCEVFAAPFDVRFPRKSTADEDIVTVLQPDICVICDVAKIDDRGCLGAPDIVIEILSPANNKKELKYKYNVYEEAGVKEYWIIRPSEKSVQINKLINGRFVSSRDLFADDPINSDALPGFSPDLHELFASLS